MTMTHLLCLYIHSVIHFENLYFASWRNLLKECSQPGLDYRRRTWVT